MSIKNDKSKLSLSLTATEAKWLVNLLERHASDRKEVARKSPSPGSSHQESAYNARFYRDRFSRSYPKRTMRTKTHGFYSFFTGPEP